MQLLNPGKSNAKTRLPTLCFVTLIIGIASGLSGMFLALLLHFIQHIAYGYELTHIISKESFLEGVSAASGDRRVLILSLCGLVAGIGWWVIYRYGKPLVSIAKAVESNKPMPLITVAHALLQIITVGLGSPLGREVAPRELAATFTSWFARKTGLSARESKIMIACAAGGGLAAVYNVPLGGALFTLEVLLCSFHWSALLPALVTCAIATVISWIGLGNEAQYHIPNFTISPSLVIWSILASPIIGFTAYWFSRIANAARDKAPKDWRVLPFCLLNFIIIGLLAIYFPALLGNGKGPIELGFSDTLGLKLATALLVFRMLIVWASLRAGAAGGLITPSLANGVLLAIILGNFWGLLDPGIPSGAFAVIGAAAFLAASQKMPITAIVLTAEFTSINFNFLIPIMFAIAGAVTTCDFCMNELYHTGYKNRKTTQKSNKPA